MSKSDIIRKLTSRKLWAAIALFVSGLLAFFGKDAEKIEQISGLIMQGAAVLAYIISEGLVDAANKPSDTAANAETAYSDPGTNYTLIHNVEEDINHE